MSRDRAIAHAEKYFDEGGFFADLARRVAIPTESQNPERAADLKRYLAGEMQPSFERLGFSCRIFDNPFDNPPGKYGPFLIAERIEDPALVTVLSYGHGDVIRGQDASWKAGLNPWTLKRDGDRLYGRGTADNKGQHTINMAALDAVRSERGGRLGFNVKFIIEMGEEAGSKGLAELVAANKAAFAADVLIASDGPRVRPERPTMTLGCRGAINFDLVCDLREGGHHSGNWGGLIANPALIVANALSSIVSPEGHLLVADLKAPPMSRAVKDALADVEIDGGEDGPAIDPWWGEPGHTPRMAGTSSRHGIRPSPSGSDLNTGRSPTAIATGPWVASLPASITEAVALAPGGIASSAVAYGSLGRPSIVMRGRPPISISRRPEGSPGWSVGSGRSSRSVTPRSSEDTMRSASGAAAGLPEGRLSSRAAASRMADGRMR